MTKKLGLIAGLLLGAAAAALAATETYQAPVSGYSAPVAVSVSTSAYTNVTPSSVRIADLGAVLLDLPSTASASMHGHIGNCTSTAISTHTVKGPIEIAPSSNGGSISLGEGDCVWMVSRHTAAESVYVQGVKLKR